MVDQARVKSGFDVEMLLGGEYLTHLLLAARESGTIPSRIEIADPALAIEFKEPRDLKRTYPRNPALELPFEAPGAFEVEILFGHPLDADARLRLFPVVIDLATGTQNALVPFVDLFVTLDLRTPDADADGAIDGGSIDIVLVDVASDLLPILENDHGITKQEVMDRLKPEIDRTIDAGGATRFKRVQALEMRKLEGDADHDPAIGLFLNLRLRTGPLDHQIRDPRGDVAAALNFLPTGQHIAFGTRRGLYGHAGADAFHRLAEKNPETGSFEHPWRERASDPKSKKYGHFNSVSVGRRSFPPANTLEVVVRAEYEVEDFFDPDVRVAVFITPTTDAQGVIDWHIDKSISVDLLFEILPFAIVYTLFILFPPGGALIAGGIIVGLLFIGGIAVGIYASYRSEKIERKVDLTLTEVFPDRLPIARRRWDPFFTTIHEVALKPDSVVIGEEQMTLAGTAILSRSSRYADNVVIRDTVLDTDGNITHLLYRVDDAPDFRGLLEAQEPGTDRREWSEPVDAEPNLFALSIDQILARFKEFEDAKQMLLLPNIPYVPRYVQEQRGGIDHILAISKRELNEQTGGVLFTFREETRTRIVADQGPTIRQQVITDLSAGGATPTEEEIQAEVGARIDALVAEEETAFEGTREFHRRLKAAIDPLLRFELPPEKLAELQQLGILELTGLVMIRLRKGHPPGEPLLYYRDRADGDTRDNLLSLPRYRHTAEGPVLR